MRVDGPRAPAGGAAGTAVTDDHPAVTVEDLPAELEELWQHVYATAQARRLAAAEGVEEPEDVLRSCEADLARELRRLGGDLINRTGEGVRQSDSDELHARLEALFGLGALEEFRRRDEVENIHCFGPNLVVLTLANGAKERHRRRVFASEEDMVRFIAHLAATRGPTARRFDLGEPIVDLRLDTNERLFAAHHVCDGPFLTLRRHRLLRVDVDGLVRMGTLSEDAAVFLSAAVAPPATNLLVAGAMSSGKTTLLRALAHAIHDDEIVATIEQTHELRLGEFHELTVAFESREANVEGQGAVTMRQLAYRVLRTGANRVIVGELRGAEARLFLRLCGSGSDGSMATIHAPSAESALHQVVTYSLEDEAAGGEVALQREAALALHFVVFLRYEPATGRRLVSEIAELRGPHREHVFDVVPIFARDHRGAPLRLRRWPERREIRERLEDSGLTEASFRSGRS